VDVNISLEELRNTLDDFFTKSQESQGSNSDMQEEAKLQSCKDHFLALSKHGQTAFMSWASLEVNDVGTISQESLVDHVEERVESQVDDLEERVEIE